MSDVNRRSFLQATSAAAIATSVHVASAQEETKDEEKKPIRMAVMGVNGRGRQLISGFSKFPEVQITHVCDPDARVIPRAIQTLSKLGKPTPKVEKDFRTVLDDPNVDVLVCAAPDHWHALATILACQAGKDVYVEKPVSHNIVEGRRMIEAARKYKRVVGSGTQRRSGADFQAAIKQLRSGRLGDVNFARCWINSTRPNIGYAKPKKAPSDLDFDLWCGPAGNDGYLDNLIHYHWHWRWNYGTGESGNNGIHALDIARWGLDVDYPNTVCCGGDKYFFDDDQETPDTQLATFDFDNAAIQWEHRTWSRRGIEGNSFGIAFYGSEASLITQKSGWSIFRGDKLIETHKGAERELAHLGNYLECLRTREKPNADIEICHKSTVLCHLANIAWRTRSTIQFDGEDEAIIGNDEAAALLSRTYRKGFEIGDTV
ncbi:MAG: dehydrogenase [Planctomycetaceae bacterium]|nr:dehydrogenase [Planctomycetaceae bacterium]